MRWLRRRGHGVHSPFAFRFITQVIGEKCHYYAYTMLCDEHQRLLLRVASALSPSEIISIGGANDFPAQQAGAGEAKPSRWVGVDETRLAVIGPQASHDDIARLLTEGYCLYIEPGCGMQIASTQKLFNAIDHGMAFELRHGPLIVIPFVHLPHEIFRI